MIPYYQIETDSFVCDSFTIGNRPLSVCIRLSFKCNLECVYCLSNSGPTYDDKGHERIPDILEALSKFELRIVWSGGEPSLVPKLRDYLLQSKQLNNVNVVASNATKLPTRAVQELTDWFQLSCPSTDRQIYENLCGTNTLDKVLYTAQKVIEKGNRVSLYIPLTKINSETIVQTIDHWVEMGVRRITICNVIPLGRAATSNMVGLTEKDIIKLKREVQHDVDTGRLTIIWPAIKKRRHFEKGYIVLLNNGQLCSPSLDQPTNILRNPQMFWRGLKTVYESHWTLFLGHEH